MLSFAFARVGEKTEPCKSFVFPNFEFEETTVTKFNLLCENTDFVKSVSACSYDNDNDGDNQS